MKTRTPHGKRRAIWPSLFPLPLVEEPLSILEVSVSPPPQITIIAAIGGPTAALPPSSSSPPPAAVIKKVATSPAVRPRPLTPLYPSRPLSRRCIVRLLSLMEAASGRRAGGERAAKGRDLLLAFEMIMPSRPGDTDGKKGRKKEDSHSEKRE